MLRIGLTGGIGSGKTTVARIFSSLGIPIFNADESAKRLMSENENLRSAIIEKFGIDSYIGKDLNRAHLAKLVFADPEKLRWLNTLIHPLTIADAKKWMDTQQSPYVIKEAALLFESEAAAGLDFVIGVTAPETLRINRILQRDKTDLAQAKKRMDQQLEESLKVKLCDFVIKNDETTPLLPQVLKIDEELRKRARQATPSQS